MASLIKRGEKWYGVYNDHAGKQKWRALYTDKRESEQAVRQLESEARAIRLGLADPQAESRRVERAKPATDHIEHYRTYLQAKGCNKWHVSYTIGDLKAFFEHAGLTYAAEVNWDHVSAWVQHLKTNEADKNSPRTINRRVSAVQSY